MSKNDPAERTVRDIRRKTRKQYTAEEKIRIVVSGLRGEESIAALCRREGIAEGLYYSWSKEFLEVESTFVAKHYVSAEPAFPIADHAQQIPFSYSAEEIPDLGRTIERHFPDPDHAVDRWVRQFLLENGATETHRLLVELTTAVKHQFAYVPREEPGVQTPAETLGRGSGSCRDFVVLMMEAVRSLGLAARFVSGYLYDPALDGSASEVTGAGSTHAWVQIYLPGAGWVECDPTNGTLGGANLIRVAVVREPGQAVPIQGTFVGGPDDFIGMDVEVTVNSMPST